MIIFRRYLRISRRAVAVAVGWPIHVQFMTYRQRLTKSAAAKLGLEGASFDAFASRSDAKKSTRPTHATNYDDSQAYTLDGLVLPAYEVVAPRLNLPKL